MAFDSQSLNSWVSDLGTVYNTWQTVTAKPASTPAAAPLPNSTPANVQGGISPAMIAIGAVAVLVGVILLKKVL